MRLSRDQVKHVAKLANLPLSSDEEDKYSDQLSKILDYIDQLNKVSTLRLRSGQASDVEPTYNISGLSNVMRKDEVTDSLSQDEAISNGSQTKNGFFVTKGVFEVGNPDV